MSWPKLSVDKETQDLRLGNDLGMAVEVEVMAGQPLSRTLRTLKTRLNIEH